MNCRDCKSEIPDNSRKCRYCSSHQSLIDRIMHGFIFRSLIIVMPICIAIIWMAYIENVETSRISKSLISEEQKDSIAFGIGRFEIVENICEKRGIHGNLRIMNPMDVSLNNAEILIKLMNKKQTEFAFAYDYYKTIPANSEIEISVEKELKVKGKFEFDSIRVDLIKAHKFPL